MTALLLYKLCITMLAVLGLSFVAEKISASLAGLLSGYPIGTAIILHFTDLNTEQGSRLTQRYSTFVGCWRRSALPIPITGFRNGLLRCLRPRHWR